MQKSSKYQLNIFTPRFFFGVASCVAVMSAMLMSLSSEASGQNVQSGGSPLTTPDGTKAANQLWYSNSEFGFKVAMTGEPKYFQVPAPGKNGQAHMFLFDTHGHDFIVSVNDLHKVVMDPREINASLDAACAGGVQNVNGVETSRATIQLEGAPGREVKADLPDKTLIWQKMFYKDNRLFALTTSGSAEWLNSAEAKKAMDSLSFIRVKSDFTIDKSVKAPQK